MFSVHVFLLSLRFCFFTCPLPACNPLFRKLVVFGYLGKLSNLAKMWKGEEYILYKSGYPWA